ncbi:MAG: DUF3160 domain-containing protein [Candidatus Falkowbacteria bacterium]|nr:DUF3160 domain-containing protein [Candidatus Falkowbacteria bacterium]
MFDSIKPEFKVNGKTNFNPTLARKPKKPIPWGPIVIVVAIPILVVVVLVPSFKWLRGAYLKWRAPQAPIELVATNTPRLANSLPAESVGSSTPNPPFAEKVKIEYLSFSDFYKPAKDDWVAKPPTYSLPLNIKTDVLNYYEVSRQLNLDPGLDSLNNQGLAIIDNPWNKDTKDFYGVCSKLIQQKLPLLITTDFLTYYYQNNLKQIFKDIEKNIFYENLWNINKELYLVAKDRYEARLAKIGDVNDALLESERLELAYLAVAIELMKPTPTQINSNKNLVQPDKFDSQAVEYFNFPLPLYLQADVTRELKLIREAKPKVLVKSPVLLYLRNYGDFSIPNEYKTDARLSNFYLTLRWLNSVWPLNYKDATCPDCLLDKADWRVNLSAAAWLAKDFSADPLLKQRWARIYKIIYFFKGLRDDFNYVYYRDTLASLFGNDYKPEELFADSNKEAEGNLAKWREQLLTAKFLDISGGADFSNSAKTKDAGLKILADFYWPNDYIFKQLTYPSVGAYRGKPNKNNVTACRLSVAANRCNGFAFDALGLVYDGGNGNEYWQENTNYNNYAVNLTAIKNNLSTGQVWHNNNYWSTLTYIKAGLNTPLDTLPSFAAGTAWNDHILRSAASAWVNLQLPLDKLSIQLQDKNNLKVMGGSSENAYVEPNLEQVNELIADSEMLLGMFNALNLSEEANVVTLNLQSLNGQLKSFKEIIKKELSDTPLSPDDNQFILNFSQAYKIGQPGIKQLSLNAQAPNKKVLKEDLSRLKLMLLINSNGGKKTLSVGPVFDYQESQGIIE